MECTTTDQQVPNKKEIPTRLQKQAPASLTFIRSRSSSVQQEAKASDINFHGPIPLLTPLVVSPPPLVSPNVDLHDQYCNTSNGADSGRNGWWHPALPQGAPAVVGVEAKPAAAFTSFFQSTCVVVNPM